MRRFRSAIESQSNVRRTKPETAVQGNRNLERPRRLSGGTLATPAQDEKRGMQFTLHAPALEHCSLREPAAA